MPQSHGLGFGHGSLTDRGNGDVEYRQTGKLTPAFRVNVADITGFSVRKPNHADLKSGASRLQQVLVIQGGGTELAAVAVNHGTAPKIEAWFRAHKMFGSRLQRPVSRAGTTAASASGLADELLKLAQLRDAGALTTEEFEQAKSRLLG